MTFALYRRILVCLITFSLTPGKCSTGGTDGARLHERLKNAYWDHIMHIKPDDLPDDEARETLAQIGRQINSSTPVSDSEVRALIEKIVSLYDQMALYGPNGPQNVLTK
jgi:hypothetical protein